MRPCAISAQLRAPDVGLAVTAIEATHLAEVGEFLHRNLNKRIAPEAWVQSLTHPWSETRPNFGMQLRDETTLVGVFCAIYSDQTIDGRVERFCNPHSWCVLESHRRHGIGLILTLLKQTGYHFTMLTPNPKVAEIFRGLRFKDLAKAMVVFPNLPSLAGGLPGRFIETDPNAIANRLSGTAKRDFELHREIPWLRFLVFGRGTQSCLVVYKRNRWKRLPCARIIHVSHPEVLDRNRGLLHNGLLRSGLLVSKVESRFLLREPRIAYRMQRTQGKLFLSRTLQDRQIRDLYSELASLDV
jgi:hypothetical protein